MKLAARLERAFALLSVALTSDIGRTLEMMAAPASSESYPTTSSLWRICYGIGLTGVFAWALWQRFSLPLDPIVDPDFWGYLSPALRKLTGSEFGHTQGRNFLYPGFLYLLLRASGDFRVITIVQHLLGLAAGGVFLLTWRRLRVFVPESLVSLRLHDGLGLVGAAIYLLAAETTRIETQLRPEAVCGFLLSLNLYFTLQFIYYSFISERRTAALVYGSASVLSLLFLASARPSFWFTAIVVMVPLAAFFVRRNWWLQKIGLAVATVLSWMLVLWPEQVLSRNDEVSQTFLPTMLFVIHADLIRDQMAADLKENASLPFARDWLQGVYTALNAEIVKSEIKYPGHYPSLKFDPEYLWFEPGSISTQLHGEFGHNVSALCAFYRFYYWRTWRYQPLRQLQKVTSQFSIYYFPKCPAYSPMKIWPLLDSYQRAATCLHSVEDYRKISTTLPAAADFMAQTDSLAQNAPIVEQPRLVRIALTVLARGYLPWLVAAMILSVFIFWKSARRKQLRWLAALVLFGCGYNASSCLEGAIVNSLDVHRYITVQMYATLLTQFLALWLILEFILEARQHRRAVV